jgi:Spy/CpxP family protein refolding chaperone
MAKTWQVILATVAIFLAGLVTGGATALGIVGWVAHHRAMNGGPAGAFGQRAGVAASPVQQFTPQLIRNFVNQLDLTEAQRATIMPIVRRTAGQLIRNRREIQLTSALAIEKMQDEIAGILTPEQRMKFENLISQQRARLQQFKQGAQAPAPPGAQPPAPPAPK